MIAGGIVVRSDALFRTLEGPDGKQIVFRSPTALGASVPPRAEMMRAHGIAHLPQDGNSHDSVHRPVAAGFYPAGGGVKITFSSCLEKPGRGYEFCTEQKSIRLMQWPP